VVTRKAALEIFTGLEFRGVLFRSVTQDKMEAHIVNFEMSLYDASDFEVAVDWVKNELKRLGITAAMTPAIETDLAQAIASGDSRSEERRVGHERRSHAGPAGRTSD